VPTDAGIEPRTVATGALAVRRSNHYRLDLIRTRLDLIRIGDEEKCILGCRPLGCGGSETEPMCMGRGKIGSTFNNSRYSAGGCESSGERE
jgi:hypothetical protein